MRPASDRFAHRRGGDHHNTGLQPHIRDPALRRFRGREHEHRRRHLRCLRLLSLPGRPCHPGPHSHGHHRRRQLRILHVSQPRRARRRRCGEPHCFGCGVLLCGQPRPGRHLRRGHFHRQPVNGTAWTLIHIVVVMSSRSIYSVRDAASMINNCWTTPLETVPPEFNLAGYMVSSARYV
ncbi:hypothetical protein K438DRAFT_2025856 [Mycena galopus ATCC 62051]|nr:hypothetical protein K438DRAFT_2025856 [Mycena galopus ATCC 62051]